jgi:uncharacterized cupin superfamily protein
VTRYLSRLLAGLLLAVAPLAAAQTAGAGPSVTIVTPSNYTITTGGVSQVLFSANSINTGAWVTNPTTATENLYVCPAGGNCITSEGGGVYALTAGQSFYLPHAQNAVTVTAPTTGHVFSASRF